MKVPDMLKRELEELPIESWQLKPGRGDHLKLFVNGQLCGVFASGKDKTAGRGWKNVRSQIRRALNKQ